VRAATSAQCFDLDTLVEYILHGNVDSRQRITLEDEMKRRLVDDVIEPLIPDETLLMLHTSDKIQSTMLKNVLHMTVGARQVLARLRAQSSAARFSGGDSVDLTHLW
jgi:hypothetical protein